MSDEARAGEHAWGWVRDNLEPGAALIFVRGISPERVIEAFGMDPATAQLVPEGQVDGALPYPVTGPLPSTQLSSA